MTAPARDGTAIYDESAYGVTPPGRGMTRLSGYSASIGIYRPSAGARIAAAPTLTPHGVA